MKRNEVLRAVRHTGWLAEQPAAFREALLARAELRERAMGAALYRQDDPPGCLYGLATGSLGVVAALGPAPPRLLHIARPGWWVGEASMVSRTQTRVEVTARAPSVVIVVAAAAITELARRDPLVWRYLGLLTVSHMDSALQLAGCALTSDPRDRVIGTLLRLARPAPHLPGPIDIPASQAELAELAGMSRNPVGPILRGLEAAGAITCRRSCVRILDIDVLKGCVGA